jgi:hypothetical protein
MIHIKVFMIKKIKLNLNIFNNKLLLKIYVLF